jgi:organic hydroperoxide reductase OsmC/OhrA
MSKKKVETLPSDRFALVTIGWDRGKGSNSPGRYSRQHQWRFISKLVVEATDAMRPADYGGDGGAIDPWMAYVAAIASGHMLAWLHAAFSHRVEVSGYRDQAEGVINQLPQGRSWVSEVILHPRVTLSAGQQVTAAQIAHFHELARRDCFIASSVKTKVTVESA